MRKMICRNGFVFVAAICLGLMVTSARGGSLDAPAGPMSSDSAMYTLNDIYNKLDTRTNVTKRTGAFTEPTGGPTNRTMHNLNDIMTLVTNRAPAEKTGQTTSYATDDDGVLRKGVAWPVPRFTVQGNTNADSGDVRTNCVLDNLTGLIWARNATILGVTNWGAAVTNCNDLIYGGYDDWRMPNRKEFESLMDWQYSGPSICNINGTARCSANNPFTGTPNEYFWTSTTCPASTTQAYMLGTYWGYVENKEKTTVSYYAWPVRGGGD